MKNIHFISGLPRSGSTMLSAILRQNPRFHAHVSSPVASLITKLLSAMSAEGEFQVFYTNEVRARILRSVVESYYIGQAKETVFDTNRTWAQKLPVLASLYPKSRFIFCVRSVVDVLQSLESLYFSNPLQLSSIIGRDANTTVFSRVDALMTAGGMVGASINGMKEAFYGPLSDRVIFVPYEVITADPAKAITTIYDFVGEKPFSHDFANIEFETEDYDAIIGAPGLHRVRPTISVAPKVSTLPSEIIARFSVLPFWAADRAKSKANTALLSG